MDNKSEVINVRQSEYLQCVVTWSEKRQGYSTPFGRVGYRFDFSRKLVVQAARPVHENESVVQIDAGVCQNGAAAAAIM